jgi:hypothetical protein
MQRGHLDDLLAFRGRRGLRRLPAWLAKCPDFPAAQWLNVIDPALGPADSARTRTAIMSMHGHNEEGWNGGRYGVYHDLNTWRTVSAAGFTEINHYTAPPDCRAKNSPGWQASGVDENESAPPPVLIPNSIRGA